MDGSALTTTAGTGIRVRLSGRLDSLTTRKSREGYTLFGSLRLDTPFRGLSRLALRLPIGSSLLAGDSAELEGVLLSAGSEGWLLDCAGGR
jgi:hypothetical protein